MSCPCSHARIKPISTSGKIYFTSGTKCFKAAISLAFSSSPEFLLNTHGHMEEARAQISPSRVDFKWSTRVMHCRQVQVQIDTRENTAIMKLLLLLWKPYPASCWTSPAPQKASGCGGHFVPGRTRTLGGLCPSSGIQFSRAFSTGQILLLPLQQKLF